MCVLCHRKAMVYRPKDRSQLLNNCLPTSPNDVWISCLTVADLGTWHIQLLLICRLRHPTEAVMNITVVFDIVSSGSLLDWRNQLAPMTAWCGHVCHISSWLFCVCDFDSVQFSQQMLTMWWLNRGWGRSLQGWSVCQTAVLKSGIFTL